MAPPITAQVCDALYENACDESNAVTPTGKFETVTGVDAVAVFVPFPKLPEEP
jgi:hypothetical protein